MTLNGGDEVTQRRAFPRRRGDDPALGLDEDAYRAFSPQARG